MTEAQPDWRRPDPNWLERATQEQAAYAAKLDAAHERVVALLSAAIPGSHGRDVNLLDLVRVLGGMTAKERRALRADLEHYELREVNLRHRERWRAAKEKDPTAPSLLDRYQFTDGMGRLRLRNLVGALACGAPPSAFGGRRISPPSPRGHEPDDMAALLAALELRAPADRAKVLDAMMRGGHVIPSSWFLAYTAVEAGLMPRPDSAVYQAGHFEALLEMRRFDEGARETDPSLRIDRATQDPQFGAVIAAGLADSAVLRWLPKYSYSRIGPAIAEAVKEGVIDRGAVLDASLGAMATSLSTNQQDVGRLTWIALAPTPPEIAARASMVWSAVAHGHLRSVITVLDSIGESRGATDMQVIARSLASATASGTTASASRAWSTALARLDDAAMSTVAVAALENPHYDIVSGALDWFERSGDPLSAVEASALREAEAIVPSRLRSRLTRVLTSRGGAPLSRAVPEMPRVSRRTLGPEARLEPMSSADAFRRALDEVAFATHHPASIAVLVDALQRWDPTDCGDALESAVIAFRFGVDEVERFRRSPSVKACVDAIGCWLDGTPMPGTAIPPWTRESVDAEAAQRAPGDDDSPTDLERLISPSVDAWLRRRLAEAVYKDRQRRPAFDLPTYRSGVLDFDDLVDRLARAEAEFGVVSAYQYEWWHALNRLDLSDTSAGRRRLSTLSSPIASRLDAFAVGEPASELERDALMRRGLVAAKPRWIAAVLESSVSGRGFAYVMPEVEMTLEGGEKLLAEHRVGFRGTLTSLDDLVGEVRSIRRAELRPGTSPRFVDRAWWLVTEPFGQDRVSAAELLSTTEWWGGVTDVARGQFMAPTRDEDRGAMVTHVLRRYLEAKREWGTFEAAYIGRALAGLRKDDSAEALVELCHAIEAGLPGPATGSALADFHRHGGGGLSAAGARLRDILELGGDPAWVCEAAAAFVVATPEPPRDSTELLTAWATAVVMLESWSPNAATIEALAPYAKGSSLRAKAAREILVAAANLLGVNNDTKNSAATAPTERG